MRPPTSEAAPVAAASGNGSAEAAAAESEEGRRRRRRRGGRGRGRGRPARARRARRSPPARSAGWSWTTSRSSRSSTPTPLTDEAGEEREYTFEEADEATLAELGLLDGGTPAARRPPIRQPRRNRHGAAEAGSPRRPDAGESAEATPAPRPRADRARRRSPLLMRRPSEARGKAGAADHARQGGGHRRPASRRPPRPRPMPWQRTTAEAAAKPKRRQVHQAGYVGVIRTRRHPPPTRTARAKPQGIWQRFRSARGGTSS